MITDVPGIRVGHWTDPVGLTGVTVVIPERPSVCGVELRGAAHSVIGLDYLDSRHLVDRVDAVVLAGGSRFGGEAVFGVTRYLEERGVGYAVGPTVVPHVPGACIFDLAVGDWRARPTRESGYAAALSAATGPFAEGNVGAGTGASVGKLFYASRAMRGGLGTASTEVGGGLVVGAVVVVNAVGDVRDPDSGALVAGTRDRPDGRRLVDSARVLARGEGLERFGVPSHTTITVVATNARLDRPQAARVASLAMLGYARALSPPHTAFDGDALFALSVGEVAADVTRVGLAAADAVARAIVRGVLAATPAPGLPAASDLA